MPTIGLLRWIATGGAVETCVGPVAEDASVRSHQVVAAAVGVVGSRHAHDRLVQMDRSGRTVERRVAEGEDAPVRGHQPVAASIGRGRHADDRLVQRLAAHGPVEAGVAVGEDATVRGDEPVAAVVGRGRHADDRLVEVEGAGRSVELTRYRSCRCHRRNRPPSSPCPRRRRPRRWARSDGCRPDPPGRQVRPDRRGRPAHRSRTSSSPGSPRSSGGGRSRAVQRAGGGGR